VTLLEGESCKIHDDTDDNPSMSVVGVWQKLQRA